ncbi:MAG: glycosyltransferase [Myxococcota bacterium]|nr:glycosyltransferase [Myxococcota bacterium]
MSSPSFCFTGGGTGGHVAPNLAIAEAIRAHYPNASFSYVGVNGKAESSMVPRAWGHEIESGLAEVYYVRSRGFFGVSPKHLVPFVFALSFGIVKALILLMRLRPTVIVATGGYVAAPILFAAFFLRKVGLLKPKIFVHEQNAVLGRLNKLAARFADQVGVAFPETKVPEHKKAYVGYPVRASAVAGDGQGAHTLKSQYRLKHSIPSDAKVIFAFGGSQGARTINRVVIDALPLLLEDPDVWVIHGTGKQLIGNAYNGYADSQKRLKQLTGLPANASERYIPKDFFHDMREYYSVADVVICRGGAGSLNEVCANGVPSVVIPKANLPGDHQAHNARSMERRGAARVIYERVDVASGDAVETVDPKELADLVFELLNDVNQRDGMISSGLDQYNPETTDLCATLVASMLGEKPRPDLMSPSPQEPERILGLSSNALVGTMRKARSGQLELSDEEKRLALYKIDGYLATGGYVAPARGCRMVGYGRFTERLDVLIQFAIGKRNGGYLKMPITRRDAFQGLALLETVNENVVSCLEEGISDPYFEARAEAITAIGRLAKIDRAAFKKLIPTLCRLSTHKAFDTRQSALRTLAEIVDDYDALAEAYRARRYDPNWKVREALLRGLTRMVDRGVLAPKLAAIEGNEVLRTSDGYRASFPIKEAFRDLPGREHLKEDF